MYCLEGVACTNFMPQPHSVFFYLGFPTSYSECTGLSYNQLQYNSDDSWVQKNGFLNNYWPHFFIRFISFLFSIPHTKTTFWSSFVGVLSDWCQKMLWFACVRPFFHPFCLHICKYVQHSDGHRLKNVPKFAPLTYFLTTFSTLCDVKTEELKDHMVISGSNWGSRFHQRREYLVSKMQR